MIDLKSFMDSKIINESLSPKLDGLLTKKYLNGRKWSLLYQGSRDGFGASDFHSHCDNKPNTLTIVKSRNGNIFGGFTRAEWKSTISWEYDKKAFVFSLVNKENKPMLFEQRSDGIYQNSTTSFKEHGPEFAEGHDIFIADDSNSNTRSFSNLGKTYTHPDYQYGSEKAKTILAGSHFFQVQEIEVFRIQQLYKEFTVR